MRTQKHPVVTEGPSTFGSRKALRSGRSLYAFFLVTFFLFGLVALPLTTDAQEADEAFGKMFWRSPKKNFGAGPCEKRDPTKGANGPCATDLKNKRNKRWRKYFTFDDTSMSLTAGNDCRTLNTGSNNGCVFTVGDNGIGEITFDYEISGQCHTADCVDWLAFWVYSKKYNTTQSTSIQQRSEVDFVESLYGPSTRGLNMNYAGLGNQTSLFPANPSLNWKGSIKVTFTGSGSNVQTVMTETNTGKQAIANHKLYGDEGYFFIFNTTPTTESNCTITISNVSAKLGPSGSITRAGYPDNCNGLLINNN